MKRSMSCVWPIHLHHVPSIYFLITYTKYNKVDLLPNPTKQWVETEKNDTEITENTALLDTSANSSPMKHAPL